MGEQSAEALYHKLDQLGEHWSDADAAWWALDEATKNILSECIGHVNDQKQSRVAKEDAARCSPIYREHLEAVRKARRAKNVARINYDNFCIYVELLRSRAATQREAMRLR